MADPLDGAHGRAREAAERGAGTTRVTEAGYVPEPHVIDDPMEAVVGTGRPPVIAPGHTFGSVTDKISSIVLTRRAPISWWIGFLIAFLLFNLLMVSLVYLLFKGTGIWGIDIPVGWGFAIVNFD